jgi:hypothetical protein
MAMGREFAVRMRTTTAFIASVVIGLSGTAMAQTTTTRRAAGVSSGRFVAIGCLTKQGTGAAVRYLLTDRRGDAPTTYRLQGDRAQLEPQVDHTVEAAGPLSPPPAGSRQYVLRVNSLTWLASSCKN